MADHGLMRALYRTDFGLADREAKGLGALRGLLGSKAGRLVMPVQNAKASDKELRLALSLLRDYEESGTGWFWSSDKDARIVYVSECIARTLGRERTDLIGTSIYDLFVLERDEEEAVERTLPLILSARKTFTDLEVRAATGESEIWWKISGRPQISDSGEFLGYHGNGSDVTEERTRRRETSRMAQYDALTSLANRHTMNRKLTATLSAYKAAKRSCALMMLDLDRFKAVNDTLGHPAGDELLKQVAHRLKRIIPENCEIGRLGGDEFQVILPDLDDRGRLGEIAKKIIEMISQPYSIEGSRCIIGTSVGIAIAPYDGIDSDELTRSADLALYAAKGGGRGQFRFYSHDLHSEAERRRQLEDDLRDALARGEMSLVYQPVVEVGTNKVVGMEAMMRWEHPEMGNIPPGVFIPIAEETNLIGSLGDWALRQACEDAARWPGNVSIAVNVSPAQFGNLNFPTVISQALAASGLNPERLELEVTESIFMADDIALDHMFKSLKVLGVKLSLDDFGTGYSALGYLKNADFDKIKIDRDFILGITETGNRNVHIIRSIVTLAKGLGMVTTAEGIEAHDELEMMRKLGVQQIQGFIYSKPVRSDEVHEAMASGAWIIEPNGPTRYRQDRMTVLRKVGLIHEDHRYDVTMRNLSRTGCLVEGLTDVPVKTQFVIDFGEGQLAVATVKRSAGSMQGLEFELPLVDDGAGGLCTRNRVSPYVLAAAGMPLGALPPGNYPLGPGGATIPAGLSLPRFGQVNESGRKSMRAGG